MGKSKKEPNPRRGKVVRASKDGPAVQVPGSAKAPKDDVFDAEGIAGELGLYWKSGSGDSFVRRMSDGRWSVWPLGAVMDLVRSLPGRFVAIKVREGEMVSEMKRLLLWVREHRCLDEVFDGLPGYRSGIHVLHGEKQVLVKTSPRFLTPVAGEWPVLRAIFEGMLNEVPGLRQLDYWFAWLKVGAESVMGGEPGNWRPGHALVMAGPRGSGKSFLQEFVVKPLLGDRIADPQKMLFGTDEYNSDCWGAELLALSEIPNPSQRMNDRVAFCEMIKQIVANPLQRMRVMRTDPWALYPFWRLVISLNDHPDKLRNFPVLTDDFVDKVIVVHCRRVGMPMPTGSMEERKAFQVAVAGELPHFLHWLLNEFVIPADLLKYENGEDASRFGFRAFHHPIIKAELFEDTTEAELLTLIDAAEFRCGDPMEGWEGAVKLWDLPHGPWNASKRAGAWHERALKLQQLLTGEAGCECSVTTMGKKFFQHNKADRTLSRLAADEVLGEHGTHGRVAKANTPGWRGWRIVPGRPRS